eukprot:TRINITY_DN2770_c0_g1_i1.p1 TRINITY_DN2770_c0_g1~~TRINITY_DN2770_c0_g1_i1.p1  ORF type:complete len:421 (-),score=126.31 TRINITY_DN2770_c0_g1_i1:133-1263(-)
MAKVTTVAECRHWKRLGTCVYGSECKFGHTSDPLIATNSQPESNLEKLELRRMAFNTIVPDNQKQNRGVGKRNRIRNDSKAGCFRRWLLDKIGAEYLNSNGGILDVAGGKGELSFELVNLNNITCTVIDPREMILEKLKKKAVRGFYHKNKVYLDWVHNKSPPTSESQLQHPNHLRVFFRPSLWSNDLSSLPNPFAEARLIIWTNKGLTTLEQETSDETSPKNLEENITPSFPKILEEKNDENLEEKIEEILVENFDKKDEEEMEKLKEVLKTCSVIVGLHPDQAAEAIVDYGLEKKKPFAVIPCCTYSKEFPGRRLKGEEKGKKGRIVKTYDDLVQYLMEKDERIRMEKVDFEGRNKVLFMLPEDFEKKDSEDVR